MTDQPSTQEPDPNRVGDEWQRFMPSTTQEPTSITGGHGQWQQMADDDQVMDDAAFVILRLQESSQPDAAHEAFQRILAALKSEPPYPYVGGAPSAPSTTQEAEKALRIIAEALSNADGAFHHPGSYGTRCVHEAEAALRSLRTQHTADQERIDELEEHAEIWRARANDLEHRRTKDREEIAQLTDRIEALRLRDEIRGA